MTTDCPRAGRWIGGCKFDGRYDRIPTISGPDAFWLSTTDLINATHKRMYVRDVCTRCGKTIERAKEKA